MRDTKPQPTVRIACYNVHFGRNTGEIARAFSNNERLARSDIIFLQEIEFHQAEIVGRAASIARQLGFDFAFVSSRPAGRGAAHGLATLSRYPLLHTVSVTLPQFRIFFAARQRIALISRVHVGAYRLTLCNIHLDARVSPAQRIRHLDAVLQKLSGDDLAIIGGDFNAIPMHLAGDIPISVRNQVKRVHAHLVSPGFASFCNMDLHTLQRKSVKLQLDHLYARGLTIARCGVETDIQASDHKPLWADAELP